MKRTSQRGGCRADFSRTCEGCEFVKTEEWMPGKLDHRCFAPGDYRGRVVGIGGYLPYVPAWCPKMKERKR